MSKVLRMVIAVDAAGSYAMPAVLLGMVPLMMAFDDHSTLIGMLILAYLVVLGLLGVAMAGLSARAMCARPRFGSKPQLKSDIFSGLVPHCSSVQRLQQAHADSSASSRSFASGPPR